MTLTNDGTPDVLKISGAIDIDEADSLRAALLQGLRLQPELALDFSQVEACDTAALQVLLCAHRDAASQGKTLRVAELSAAVSETATALGFSFAGVAHAESEEQANAA